MFCTYVLSIVEYRSDGRTYLCVEKIFHSYKKAIAFACNAVDNMTGYPKEVVINKVPFRNHSMSKNVFSMCIGESGFNYFDLYLN